MAFTQQEKSPLLKQAVYHFNQKDYVIAARNLNAFLKDNPKHQTALYFRGCALYELNDFEGALTHFEQLTDKYYYALSLWYTKKDNSAIYTAFNNAYEEIKPILKKFFKSNFEKAKLADIFCYRAVSGYYANQINEKTALTDLDEVLNYNADMAIAYSHKARILTQDFIKRAYQSLKNADSVTKEKSLFPEKDKILGLHQKAISLNSGKAELYFYYAEDNSTLYHFLISQGLSHQSASTLGKTSYEEIVKSLQAVLKLEPDNKRALLLLRDAHKLIGWNLEETINVCQQTVQFDETSKSYGFLIFSRVFLQQNEAALQDCNEALQKFPTEERFVKYKLELLEKLKRYNDIVQFYDQKIIENATPNQKLHFLGERVKFKEKSLDFNGAITDYEMILEMHPNSTDKLLNLANLYYQQAQTSKALLTLDKIMQLVMAEDVFPSDTFLIQVARFYEKLNEFEKAALAYHNCCFPKIDLRSQAEMDKTDKLENLSEIAEASYRFAKLQMALGCYKEATEMFEKALRFSNPKPWTLDTRYWKGYAEDPVFNMHRASVAFMLGNYQGAEYYLDKAHNSNQLSATIDKRYGGALSFKGYFYYRANQFDQSLYNLNYQLHFDSHIPHVLHLKGKALLKQKKFGDAYKVFLSNIDFLESKYYIGVCQEQGLEVTQNTSDAQRNFQEILSLSSSSTDPLAFYRLGVMHHAGRGTPVDGPKAANFYQKVLKAVITTPAPHMHYLRHKAAKRLKQLEDSSIFNRQSHSFFKNKKTGKPISEVFPQINVTNDSIGQITRANNLQVENSEIIWEKENGQPKKLGQGGFAAVYAGEWRGWKVAVKIFFNTDSQSLNEIEKLKGLKHAHVIELYGVTIYENYLCMIMPRMTQSLYQYIHKNPAYQADLATILRQMVEITSGLNYLHNNQIGHYDIKSLNILLDNKGALLISDFGLARGNETLNQNGVCGSPRWMAPEQFMGYPEIASDVYSLGLVAYELCNAELPAKGLDSPAQIRFHRASTTQPEVLNPAIKAKSPRFDGLIISMWQFIAANRPTTASIMSELKSIQQEIQCETNNTNVNLNSVIPSVTNTMIRSNLISAIPQIEEETIERRQTHSIPMQNS